jgi:outer membrane protein assembly factor BamD
VPESLATGDRIPQIRAVTGRLTPAITACVLLLLGLTGCAGTKKETSTAGDPDSAQRDYERALNYFRKGKCLDAEPMFRKVRREYPYSRFAALAELRVADCLLKEGKHAESVQAYQQFIRFRPSHEQVPYAHFKIAHAHFEQIPGGFFLMPPAYERDQAAARQALTKLRRFMLDFPEDHRIAEAREMMEKVVKLLAQHELSVARFYLSRGVPKAAIGRLRTLLNAYEGCVIEPEAMLLLGRTYLEVRSRNEARDTFQELLDRHPESDEAKRARRLLQRLSPPSG